MPLIERSGAVTIVHPTGAMRRDSIAELDDQVRTATAAGVPMVVIDLSETPLIDGAGLEWILTLNESCCRRGGCVQLCNVGELCADILRITAVGASVGQYDDIASALGSFA